MALRVVTSVSDRYHFGISINLFLLSDFSRVLELSDVREESCRSLVLSDLSDELEIDSFLPELAVAQMLNLQIAGSDCHDV